MVTRIKSGHYKIQEEETKQERKNTTIKKKLCVVKGNVANEEPRGALGGQFGFSSTKWYAYKSTFTEVVPRVDFSPTAPVSAFTKHSMEIEFIQDEFDSKSEAVDAAVEKWINEYSGSIR